MLPEEQLLLIAGTGQARGVGAGDERCFHELVVFEKADKHAGHDPGDGDLVQLFLTPGVEGFGGALAGARRFVLGMEGRVDLRLRIAAAAQVVFQQRDAFLEVFEECGGDNHAVLRVGVRESVESMLNVA